jgi:hypothetical protein
MQRRELLAAAVGAVVAPVAAAEPTHVVEFVLELRTIHAEDGSGFTVEQWFDGRLIATDWYAVEPLTEVHDGVSLVSTRAPNGVRRWGRA